MRVMKLVLMAALVGVIGVGVIQAEDVQGVALFPDGRVNNWQIDAPAAVYCVFTESEDGGVFQRVEAWGLNGDKLLEASAAQIGAAGTETLAAANGYTLEQLSNGSFQFSAPNGYVFEWERGDTNC